MPVLRHAVVAAEELRRHVELAQLAVLGTVVEHVRETAVGPEHLGIRSSKLRDQVEHEVALRGSQPGKAHASERAQVLTCDRPGPLSLDVVHYLHSVHEESAPESVRGVKPRRTGRAADKQAAQQTSDDDGEPGGDEGVESQVVDDLEERRHPEIFSRKFSVSRGYQASGEPQDGGSGDYIETKGYEDLHKDVDGFQ